MNNLINVLTSFGLEISELVLDGSIQRCRCRGSKQMNGWYVGRTYGDHIYCNYGDWRSGEKNRYTDNGVTENSEAVSVWRLLAESEKKKREKLHRAAGLKSEQLIKTVPPLSETGDMQGHPYLQKKGVSAYGAVRVYKENLIVPLFKSDGMASGYQTIDNDGRKKFLFGSEKKGSCFVIEGGNTTICVCEGYATGASIHEATGFKVLVAFDAGNMVAVAKKLYVGKNKNVLICADNDHGKEKNTGVETAKAIAREYGFAYVYPTGISGTDFNDLHHEEGIDAVQRVIIKGRVVKIYEQQEDKEIPHFDEIINPPGILKDIADYYNATAVKPQPLFSVAAGLILGSVLMGRRYQTGLYDNYSSLYFVISAKSGTGKDHVKTVVRRILGASDLDWLERSGGFTAANTVIKSLERQPLQVSFWEEFGQRLKEAGTNNRSLYGGVFRQLLDIWSSCHSTSRGEEYSNGNIPSVDRPALTLVGMSTPKQLFEAVNESLIEQGFVNRILPFISNSERFASPLTGNNQDPPEKIISWCRSLWPETDFNVVRAAGEYACPGKAEEVTVGFSPEALQRLNEIEQVVVDECNDLEKIGLDDLLTRNREMTMRVSLIVAVMDSCLEINTSHIDWSWKLVCALYGQYITAIKRVSSGSGFEQAKKQALADLRKRGAEGMRACYMPKVSPWSKWEKKLRQEILTELQDAGLAELIEKKTGKRGPARSIWVAVESEEE